MKKILALMFLLIFFVPMIAFATASSIGIISDYTDPRTNNRIITIKFVAASTDGSISNLTLTAKGSTSGLNKPLLGWCLYSVHIDGDHAGAHDGAANAAVLTDTDAGFIPGALIGYVISNTTDGTSTATITANTASTVTGTLSGGTTDNDWDVGDTYTIAAEPKEDSDLYIYQGGIDLLDGNGVDMVDNTTERDVYFAIDSLPATRLITGDLVLTITQASSATASALGFLEIVLY